MPEVQFNVVPELRLEELAAYHDDIVASLRLFFSPSSPASFKRFEGRSHKERNAELHSRLVESDVRSSLAVLISLEAYFRVDFEVRCKKRLKDDLSVHFRELRKLRGNRIRLDEDIIEGWKRHTDAPATLISQIRSAFKFRHWLAHGRYWSPRLGQKYDFVGMYLIASAVVLSFPFASQANENGCVTSNPTGSSLR